MKRVELYGRVRYVVRIEGISGREAARRFGVLVISVQKVTRNRGKTWGSSDIRACPGAVAYDSVLACRHPPICPVCRVPSWKLGL